jgi:hypothetical protein
MNYKTLKGHEDKVLVGLVEFYLKSGYTSATYQEPERGGIYENKLGDQLGYKDTPENLPPPEFISAAKSLEEQGFVRRIERETGNPLLGIWPTRKGVHKAEYLSAPWYRRVWMTCKENAATIVVSVITTVITTVITMLVASLLGLFGLHD